ncbi:TetR/AcrR family transcriptional regulator [Arthrobacter sp. MI7-26]|uniref:TetR/AcrR family transcriptional regulator n=1 Tax=Arthrobacter sp. MI7-26 TaxID=2993653 RepID=UPI00224988F0|nr:TetR/AcrR family transcriptional regulator [Arthrobacter sp. MI7-26]MCX2747869.1 TetR/AcrR family transcriptional regulator [Arthrobacter sp. MI7-26]
MVGSLVEQQGTARAKQRLDPESIVAAGLQIAAKPGTTTVTVRELGTLLGVDPTAIYRHFRNKEDLMGALLDRLFSMGLDRVTAPREQWRTRLTQMASAMVDLFTEFPAIGAESILINAQGPAELDTIEFILDALNVAGLEGQDAVRHYASLSTYVLSVGAGIARAQSSRNGTANDEQQSSWLGRSLPVTAASHPYINAVRDQLLGLSDREVFFLGVDALLDAAEASAMPRSR